VTAYLALLRAVNVGGTGKLPMTELKQIAGELGLGSPRTFIASGNLVFTSDESESKVREMLEKRLADHMGKPVAVMVRTAAEMAAVVKANPFADEPGNRVIVTFLPDAPARDALDDVRNLDDERMALGKREIYVAYGPRGLGKSKLRIPVVATGTARNMNSVAKLAEMAKEMA
jgi:uncharacterized protein (DUF1697 family)